MDASYIFLYRLILVLLFTQIMMRKVIRFTYALLKESECIVYNYQGKEVVTSMGVAFLPVIMAASVFALILNKKEAYIYIPYLLTICAMGFAGLLDDLIGNKAIKGIKNHIASFFKGKLTTGFAKAFMGLITAMAVSIFLSSNIIDFFLNLFIIALFTNALNLFDLRPGRCIKAFLLISLIVILLKLYALSMLLPLIIACTAALAYISYDLREICMLGDSGSNILGITLGYFTAAAFETVGKLVFFMALIAIHIFAEYYSISKLISSSKLLSYIDSLGRSRFL
jgi:UDP-GlcNAc:undecaprenyl-phosphate GlcNAc-1-phosphate transferase